jgi:CheY-like chemotaxis protein
MRLTRVQALAWCKRRVADVLDTDIRLPGRIDGWRITERCREHDPRLPVIYATGLAPVEARSTGQSDLAEAVGTLSYLPGFKSSPFLRR